MRCEAIKVKNSNGWDVKYIFIYLKPVQIFNCKKLSVIHMESCKLGNTIAGEIQDGAFKSGRRDILLYYIET